MQTQPGFIRYGDNRVHCLRIGSGSKLLIAFHGFGNDASLFVPLADALRDEYTTIAVDLPGHGATQWLQPSFRKKDLMALIQGIRADFGVDRCTLAGFSLGGRVCLCIAELQPDWIERMVLIAPDGMEKNFWYYAATSNILGKRIFSKIMQNPAPWLRRVELLHKYRFIDTSRLRFVQKSLSDPSVRQQLAYVWPITRHLTPQINLVKWNINRHKIDTFVVMGRHDRIFPPVQGERFVKNLKTGRLQLLEAGHQLLQEALLPQLAGFFR